MQHIATPKHKILVLKSDYNRKIDELCDLFKDPVILPQEDQKRGRGRPGRCTKTKGIRKERVVSKPLLLGD